jgi:DNA topoisomerase-3
VNVLKTVVLAEKPSQAKAYSQAFEIAKRERTHIELKPCSTFPNGATITWGIGHLVSLKMPNDYKEEWKKWDLKNLPIIPERFEFKVSEDKKTQFNAVKKLFNEAHLLVNACDIDREGSNIFYSIYNMTGARNKTIKRLWINSLEEDEVRKGFNNLHDNKKDLMMYSEARGRQIGDWLVGINASQIFTLLLAEKGIRETISAGRVSSPTVYMIYQRQKEIENFVSKPFFELLGQFKVAQGMYEGKARVKTDTLNELTTFLEEKGLSFDTEIEGIVKELEKKEKRTKSPKLHSLSTLQTVANKKWKYSPAKVLETMQSLYEKKILTYPRTDTQYITENEFAYLVKNIEDYKKLIGVDFEANITPNKRYVDGSRVQEHYAILPTKAVPSESVLNGLSEVEKNIYDEVLRTTLAMFHRDYRYEETKIVTAVNGIEFETIGKVELEKGWKALFSHQKDDEDDKTENNKVLPIVSKNEKVLSVLKGKEGRTTPPKPFTEGGLINLMKTAGKMVEDEADSEILKEVEGIGTEATRSGIIETIKKNGYIEVKKNIVYVTKKGEILCDVIEGTLLSSPSMTAKWESYLKKIGNGEGSTDTFISNINKFVLHLMEVAPQKMRSAKIEMAITEKKASERVGGCPCCRKGQIQDKGKFYGCSEYQNGCKFSINKTIASKRLSEKAIKQLLEKGKTSLIKGFKSSKGKPFEAILKIDTEKNKIDFEFSK